MNTTDHTREYINRINNLCIQLWSPTYEQRQIGKTYSAAMLTKKVNGILLTFNEQSARQIREQYEIDCRSISSFEPRGLRKSIILDQDLAVREMINLTSTCQSLFEEIDCLNEQLELLASDPLVKYFYEEFYRLSNN